MARQPGRIRFEENPWPKGHRVAQVAWSGRLDDRGLWFDLHLESADYDEGDPEPEEQGADEYEDPPGGDWSAKIVWGNYGACSLSSTKWDHPGFLVGTAEEPLDWKRLAKRQFRVDPLPARKATTKRLPVDADGEPAPAFGIYLLGHDTVADHQIRFTPRRGGFQIDWQARIALTYVGSQSFRHRMSARLDAVLFAGFRPADGLPPDVAADLLQVFAVDGHRYRRRSGAFLPA